MPRASGHRTAAPPQKAFDARVFERVKRDDRQAAAWHQEPLGGGELLRRQAEIERDPGDRLFGGSADEALHIAEASLDQLDLVGMAGGQGGAAADRLGISVDTEDVATRGREQGGAIAAAPEG